MVCRLCLQESVEYLIVFNENNEILEPGIIKVVVKHLKIELLYDDEISNTICRSCWHQLRDFHSFSAYIEQKQEALKQQLLLDKKNAVIKAEKPLHETPVAADVLDVQMKDFPLCEPEIDINDTVLISGLTNVSDVADKDQEDHLEAVTTVRTSKRNKTPASKAPKRVSKDNSKSQLKYTKKQNFNCKKTNSRCVGSTRLGNEMKKATIRELDAYIAAHTKLSCCICHKSLQDFAQLKKHFRNEHQCTGYVVCCNNRFPRRTTYVDHLKLHENAEYFKCTLCNKVLASRGCYYNHMMTVHPQEEELKFGCNICERKFAKQYILDYHMINHQQSTSDHMCMECSKCFRTSYTLKAHYKRMHLNATITICDVCGKNFRSNQSFQMHKATVHQGVQLPEAQCPVCQKWLKDARSLHKHMYKHEDEQSGKKFICPTCDIAKPTRNSLDSHIRYHHSNKTFDCTMCEKVFKRRRGLEEHMATHTGQDLYTCEFCVQTFKSHANMHNHKKKMHPNEWIRKYTQPKISKAASSV